MVDTTMVNQALRLGLFGKACLKTTVNVETGVDLLLHMGKWVEYAKQSRRLRVTHRGEYMLMISCLWRVEGPEGRIVDSADVHDKEPWQSNQSLLEGLTVSEALLAPSLDLAVSFDGGFQLDASCQAGQQPENWFLLGPRGFELAVGPDCDLHVHNLG